MVHSFMLFCRTYVFPRFLNPGRAEHFVKLAKARLAPSSLAFKKGDTADTTKYGFFVKLLNALVTILIQTLFQLHGHPLL